MKILVIGGTNFFGKRKVQLLLDKNLDVTLLTRGIKETKFNGKFRHWKVDRNDKSSFEKLMKDEYFDAVLDQVCNFSNYLC